jgi:hypothetical protein
VALLAIVGAEVMAVMVEEVVAVVVVVRCLFFTNR